MGSWWTGQSARHANCGGVTPAAELETLVPSAKAWQGLRVPGAGLKEDALAVLGASVQSPGEEVTSCKKDRLI